MKTNASCYALVDCNNFFASCERIFRPDLKHRPVLVLSNNDGCVIARSAEVKTLGIKMGMPYFQIQHLIKRHNIAVFSSNYTLYGDVSTRVMNTLRSLAPKIEVYSIDEAFLDLSTLGGSLYDYGYEIKKRVKQHLGIDVCIGIAPTKTLAKLANYAAKTYPKTEGVVDLMDENRRERLLKITPIREIWGIGRQLSASLKQQNIATAWELINADMPTLQKQFSINLAKTIQELKGISCHDFYPIAVTRQQIIQSRSFSQPITDLNNLKSAITYHAEKGAEKLRRESLFVKNIGVFIGRNRFNHPHEPYLYEAFITLPIPTNDSRIIVQKALEGLQRLWRAETNYHKAGISLRELSNDALVQTDLFNPLQSEKSTRLMQAIDGLNQRYGSVISLATSKTSHDWKMKREHLSPSYTTKWDQLAFVK